MKKTVLALFGILVFTSGVILFIIHSNDHDTCETKIEITYGDNGEKITTETHICKEKYNI
ncbi:hypothetical protein [Psychroserpens sp.]|uniref:hypothetical protein n=1 Tax=Psychroserpens sp. TaxID=2020870 RepID=UPI001B2D2872|nr:hypothetical protein [Psychroserpens sp.]MBO6606600.1 hypothetical protein [Psychroserpens sp.]MBO6632206.1 hypothetical protein [Psychroserpens sp.]MBO6653304.1 hypothetical protein [Psychroserpens sp.]MBO6680669.1 hypothetical protein [Psychroserpens sp.]MBO6750373.1 hypothetical protein [Psychroserpens sp.]